MKPQFLNVEPGNIFSEKKKLTTVYKKYSGGLKNIRGPGVSFSFGF